MNKSILARIQALGGDISQVKNHNLVDLQYVSFKEVLHFRNDDEPFCEFYDEFYMPNQALLNNLDEFIDKAIAYYYISADDDDTAFGQAFWRAYPFTPLTANTPDYEEWFDYFDDVDLSKFLAVTGGKTPEFLILMHTYGFPDHYFICTNDLNVDNPTVFSTDHEVYFHKVDIVGDLSTFLNQLMSKQEARQYIQTLLDDIKDET